MELTQHIVKGVAICSVAAKKRTGVVVEVSFGRPLLGTTLSVFMPTTILLVLSQMSRVFGQEHLEMVIEVNLTLILVLATFFIGISQSLPMTAYIKMIDIWLIIAMLYPFCVVMLYSTFQFLKAHDQDIPVPTKIENVEWKNKHVTKIVNCLLDFGLPVIFLIF